MLMFKITNYTRSSLNVDNICHDICKNGFLPSLGLSLLSDLKSVTE